MEAKRWLIATLVVPAATGGGCGGCGAGMDLVPTAWGTLVREDLAREW
jgi:hypothetical protein